MSTPQTLLNVDDTEAARYAKSRALRHAGYDVVDAGTGTEALKHVDELRPALVLLDVRLPDMSGIDVCRVIKQRWPTTLVLQTSATYVSSADRTRGLEGGADAYLIQPIEADELVAAVRALLRLHAAEERTRTLNETLERRIEERTRELEEANRRLVEQMAHRERVEAALVQAQKMEAVGQLIGTVSHDFNNVLASLVGYIQLMRRRTADENLLALIDKAKSAADRGKRLTSRLLAFSRSDTLLVGAIDIRALMAGVHDWLAQAAGSGLTLQTDCAEGDLVALTDAHQLELALLNLVINARDAMGTSGRILIEVEAREITEEDEDLKPGRYIVISVQDSGSGMAEEVAARAFDPFFTTKPAGQGTGLGLAQVFNVGRLSQGTARIRTATGSGTTVSLWLRAGQATDLDPLLSNGSEGADGWRGHGEYVVFVDDEADIRRTAAELLTQHGYEVACAASGAEALASIAQRRPDLLVLDFAMPGMDGLQVARKAREAHPDLPILFVSGHLEYRTLDRQVPGARLLRKPFDAAELYALVRRCLTQTAPAR